MLRRCGARLNPANPLLQDRRCRTVVALALADVATGPIMPPRLLPGHQSGYRIVEGPNETFASFALHAWQGAVDNTVGPELVKARASFPELVAQQAATEVGDAEEADALGVDDGAIVVLEGAGGGRVEIPVQAAWMCHQIRPILRGCNVPIRLPKLTVNMLNKVVDYCTHHKVCYQSCAAACDALLKPPLHLVCGGAAWFGGTGWACGCCGGDGWFGGTGKMGVRVL